MNYVEIEFWKNNNLTSDVRFKRSWDGSVYVEMGDTPCSGFGNPPPGRWRCSVESNNELKVCSETGSGGRIIMRPHRRIFLNEEVARELVESNSI